MNNRAKELIDRLCSENTLEYEEFTFLIKNIDSELLEYTRKSADTVRRRHFSNKIYTRGLIEFTNICKNDCYYCGIRKSNSKCDRYRLRDDEIYSCCEEGYSLGLRTFVLQGGEDGYFTDNKLCNIISHIKELYPDCAVTLSLGERDYNSYKALKAAGADRYLLRHETANEAHYGRLHPEEMKLSDRKECLFNLKSLGYQVGAGFMVGSPYQTVENLAEDLLFLKELRPHMIGIGPFIAHRDTPFLGFENGSLELTLFLLSILRLIFPKVLLPATTALATLNPYGREMGIKSGANVIMPNLSPENAKEKYLLYNGKLCSGSESAYNIASIAQSMKNIGYKIVTERGDYKE